MIIFTDFNARDETGSVLALIEVLYGINLLVKDSEGNSAAAKIKKIDKGLIQLDIDWDTWESAPPS